MDKEAPEGKQFNLNGNKLINTITELALALEKASDADYKYHVSPTRNDFAFWIAETHNKNDLAEKIAKAKSRKEAVKILKKAINKHYASQKVTHFRGSDKLELPHGFPGGDHHHEFIHPQFVYGIIFGVIATLIALAILGAV